MPTKVLDLELTNLSDITDGLQGYPCALILYRLHGIPMGCAWIPIQKNRLTFHELQETFCQSNFGPVFEHLAREYLQSAEVEHHAPPTVTVAICTRDRPEDLARCLRALLDLPDEGQEYLVVDNCPSTDATQQVVASCNQRVRYVRENRPGLNIARNRALREAQGEIVAFIDDDAVPDSMWLRSLLRNFTNPLVQCVTGLTMPMELETEAQEWFERYSSFRRGFYRTVFDNSGLSPLAAGHCGAGANMALRRNITEHVGDFDEALDGGTATRSGGDTDMFIRILAAGYKIVYEPAALNWHRHRRSWQELCDTIYGYGVGTYAAWTRSLLLGREFGVFLVAFTWLWQAQLPALLRGLLRRPGHVPPSLPWLELKGCLYGPFAYWNSRKHINTFNKIS